MYKYRGLVSIPPLEMVDDVITAVECGSKSVKLNAAVNAFIESKKLSLSSSKCSKIHIGNKKSQENCPDLKVNSVSIKCSVKEKYLGDHITNKGNSKETIKERNLRGDSILANMRAILQDIPLGNRRTQIGLILRQAWFINGCFFNSEIWTGFNENDLKYLTVIDHKILRLITGAQAKVPIEMLFLETSQLPLKNIMASRRILYLHNILKRNEDELVKRVFYAMKNSPLKGDWSTIVFEDMELISLTLSEEEISQMSKTAFKTIVKTKMRRHVLDELNTIKGGHTKVSCIEHSDLKIPQKYITSSKFSNKQKSLLFNLRCKSQSEFLSNFSSSTCIIPCKFCQKFEDSQEHSLSCEMLQANMTTQNRQLLEGAVYSDLFSNVDDQLRITEAFQVIIATREKLRDTPRAGLPGHRSGPRDVLV